MFSACRKMTPEMMVYTSPGQTDRMNLHEPQVTDALCGAPCWKKQLMEALWQLQLQHIPLQSLQMIKNVFVSFQGSFEGSLEENLVRTSKFLNFCHQISKWTITCSHIWWEKLKHLNNAALFLSQNIMYNDTRRCQCDWWLVVCFIIARSFPLRVSRSWHYYKILSKKSHSVWSTIILKKGKISITWPRTSKRLGQNF